MELSTTTIEGEKRDFEDKILELEAHNSVASRQTGELRTRVEEMEEQNITLETEIKIAIERQHDIIPFYDQACLIWRNIHQVQLKLEEEIYKIK